MSRPFLSLVLALLACACSTSQWVQEGVTAEGADRDLIDCQRWAGREATLRAEGFYGPTPPVPHGYRVLDEARLADFCMRAKGYERASVR
jgi:hypothetical protein